MYTVTIAARSEEHTSELQSRVELVCRLLLEKKNSPGRIAVSPHTWCSTSPAGRGKSSAPSPSVSKETCIASGQILPAVIDERACFIGCPSVLPTHTTIARLGV